MRASLCLVFVIALFEINSPSVYAENAGPCANDAKKYCQGSGGAIGVAKCLKAHEKELTAECVKHREAKRLSSRRSMKLCKSDVAKFCKEVKGGNLQVAYCLKEHQKELTPGCLRQFEKIDDEAAEMFAPSKTPPAGIFDEDLPQPGVPGKYEAPKKN